MYHVISTGFTAILLYLISYFFYRIGYYSLQFHRKFWNTVLALTFFFTAIAGLFVALQVNYKWNIPFIKSVIKWHVEFGIGLACTGIFHFLWHLNFYGKLFTKTAGKHSKTELPKLNSADIKTNLFITGFVSSSVQFLLMREIMNITGGYELITGSFLASWLIVSAIGASFGGNSDLSDIRKINLIFSLSPVISLFLLLFLSRLYLSPGETPSFLASIIYTMLVLIPFCMVSGFTFIKLLSAAKSENNLMPGKSFSIETTGGIVSGLLISLLTAGLLSTYKLFLLIFLLSVAYVLITYYLRSFKTIISVKLLLCVLSILIIISDPDIFFRQILLPGIKVTGTKDTPYGNITKGKYKGEESLYYNQRLLAFKDDVTEREEDIHYAMLQSELPEKVILISGSLHSHLPEILKYPVSRVIYIERDPALAEYETSLAERQSDKLVVVNKDAYRFIRNANEKVDVVILLIPPPSTLLLNRYYTSEFFGEVKKRIKPGGIFMCSPGPADNYFNKESLNLYSSIYNSLAFSFKNVKPVAGNKLYFIASDNPISTSFCQLTEKRHISNIYVSPDYLEDDLITRKSDEIISLINHDIKQNRSAFPYASFHSQSYLFSKNLDEKIPAIVLMIIVFAMPVMTIRRRNMVMYFTASSLAGFEIIILLILQLTVGNMYQMTGLIIAGLMTGLAVGSGVEISFLNSFSLRWKAIILLLFYIGFGLIFNYLTEIRSVILSITIIVFSVFLPALFTGYIFRELTIHTEGVTTPSAIYSADLAGSALGFMFITGLAVPVFGIQISVFLLSVLIFGGILFGIIRNKS
jgi:spermidine synthase